MRIAIVENAIAASISTIIDAGPIQISFSKVTVDCYNHNEAIKLIKHLNFKPCLNH